MQPSMMVRIQSKVNRLYKKEEVMSNETNSSLQFLRNSWAPNLATHCTFQKLGQWSFYKTSYSSHRRMHTDICLSSVRNLYNFLTDGCRPLS